MEFVQPPSERLLKPLQLPNKLLLGPGPSNPHPRILRAMSSPMLGHLHPEFLEVMDDIIAGLQYLFQTFNSLTIAVSGTGHAGMEASFVNLVEEGEKVLILRNGGLWGERAREVAERCGKNDVEKAELLTVVVGINRLMMVSNYAYHKKFMAG